MNILLKDIKNESLPIKTDSSQQIPKSPTLNNEPETYCICKKAFDTDDDDMMIECDACKNWFHGK